MEMLPTTAFPMQCSLVQVDIHFVNSVQFTKGTLFSRHLNMAMVILGDSTIFTCTYNTILARGQFSFEVLIGLNK